MQFVSCSIAEETTQAILETSSTQYNANESFNVTLKLIPTTAIAGIELSLSYNAQLIHLDSVSQGTFFGEENVIFQPGEINNTSGDLNTFYCLALGQTFDDPGVVCILHFTAQQTDGYADLLFTKLIITDSNAEPLTSISSPPLILSIGDPEAPPTEPTTPPLTPPTNPSGNQVPIIPQAPLGPTLLLTENNYTYSIQADDDDNDELYYRFFWGDHSQSAWLGPYPPNTPVLSTHSYSKAGVYSISVLVNDTKNQSISAPLTVEVYESNTTQNTTQDPIISDSLFTYSPTQPKTNETISLSINPTTTIKTVLWDFGDQTTSSQLQAEHHYTSPGTYYITLTLEDSTNTTYLCQDSITITSEENKTAPSQQTPGFSIVLVVCSCLIALYIFSHKR